MYPPRSHSVYSGHIIGITVDHRSIIRVSFKVRRFELRNPLQFSVYRPWYQTFKLECYIGFTRVSSGYILGDGSGLTLSVLQLGDGIASSYGVILDPCVQRPHVLTALLFNAPLYCASFGSKFVAFGLR